MDIKIVGMTDQQEAFIGSKEYKFRINEFLIIEDRDQGDILGEIVEAHTYNRFIPMDENHGVPDQRMIENLREVGFDLDKDTVYIGKVRLLEEGNYPIETGSVCRIPNFQEVKSYFISCTKDTGLTIGVIRNTEEIAATMEDQWKNLCKTFQKGKTLEQKDVPYLLNLYGMNEYPHIGIFGGSGSGKSFGLRVLLEELMRKEIPTLVLDPHYEMDFSERFLEGYGEDYENSFEKFTIGKNIGIEFSKINTKDLKNLLNTSSHLTEAMENVVENLHRPKDSLYTFRQRIEDLRAGQELGQEAKIQDRIIDAAEKEERENYERVLEVYKKYNDKCPASSVMGVYWRFNKLENLGIFNQNTEDCERALLSRKLVVLQGSIKIIQVFSTYLMNLFYDKRRNYRDQMINNESGEYFPPFIVVTDEAHNFAPQSKDGMREIPSKYVLREIAQEGRKYGVFLILATQRPSLLDSTITAQLNTKLIFRTTRATDIDTIREETDLSPEESKRLPYLKTGDVFLSESAVGRTVSVRIRAAHTNTPHKENPFLELNNKSKANSSGFYEMIQKYLPINSFDLDSLGREIQERDDEVYSSKNLSILLNDLAKQGMIEVDKSLFGDVFKAKSQEE